MIKIKECSCGGINENCYRCSGSGRYSVGSSNGNLITSSGSNTGFMVYCPHCVRTFAAKRSLNKHLKKVHKIIASDSNS